MSLPSVPAGFQYTTLSKPGGGWDLQSIPYNQSPAVVTGDTLMTPLMTAEGHPVTVTADGIASVDTGGSTARQLLVGVDIYRVATDAFMGAATFAINDQAPGADPFDDTLVLSQNQLMGPFSLGALFSDAELDMLTYAVTAGSLPHGTALNASTGDITGTPDTLSSGSFTVTASDPYNATGDLLIDWAVLNRKINIDDRDYYQ